MEKVTNETQKKVKVAKSSLEEEFKYVEMYRKGNLEIYEKLKELCDSQIRRVVKQYSNCGIPQEDLPFVFDRFYKADKARTRGKSGTGLGLAIVRNIIKGHHGEITVESKDNEGTTFTFIIPHRML